MSLAIAGTLAALPLLHPSPFSPWFVALGAAGAGVLALTLVLGRPAALPWALVLLGAAYLAALVAGGPGIGVEAPPVGVGLLAAGELAAWSLDARAGRAERGVNVARAAGLGGVLAVAAGLATTPLLASMVGQVAGALPLFLAAAAVVAALAVVAGLAWRLLAA